jgi:Fe-S-cluster-containing hydrogenase component 2/CRP-like cAMP-binding protein
MISVDHDQCILCGRCQRGCNWIKHNNVIGRGGKGYESRVVFDLDNPMGESTCVSCGECAVSCPTGALEFQEEFIKAQVERVEKELKSERKDGDIVTADELITYDLFKDIPYKFLQFNGAAVVRRKLQPGDVLCNQGEYGATAFIIIDGQLEILFDVERGKVTSKKAGGLLGRLFGGIETVSGGVTKKKPTLTDVGAIQVDGGERLLRDKSDVILGEMACMNRGVRSATIVATEPSHILEIRRNVLFMLQRNAVSREILDKIYRERSLKNSIAGLPLLESLEPELKQQAAEFLTGKATYVSVDPLQTIFKQGDQADAYYVNRLGFVKVSQKYGRDERVINYLGPGSGFGEIGLLSGLSDSLDSDLASDTRRGTRTATCSALDHVELYRIDGSDFRKLLKEFPAIRSQMLEDAQKLLQNDREAQSRLQAVEADSFLEQGLFLAQSLLVLDLERCTRCDECTKACSDTHDGVTRLIREGLRFDKFLVASSCRSCMDPVCLVGCPVDAIHRNGESKEIEIEDYCIGCGLCANNCPYGNINMHGFPSKDKTKAKVVQQRATTCDLCRDVGGPSCVHACPHEAAFRMTGDQLKSLVGK